MRRLVAALAVAALVSTACHGMRPPPGSGGDGDAGGAHKQQLTADKVIASIQANGDLASQIPADLKQTGLRVTTSPGYPPMEMFDSDGKTIIGVDPSLAKAIGKVLGLPVKINREDFNAQIPGVLTGRYDMVMSSVTDNAERRAKATMVDYAEPGQAFVVRNGNPSGIKTPTDLCGKTVAVVDNGSALAHATKYSKDCKAKGDAAVEILKFTGDQDALLQVRSGRADADINDYPVAAYRAETSNGKLAVVPIPDTEAPFGIVMLPKRTEAIEVVRKAVDELIATGAYQEILQAWNVEQMAITKSTINGGE